MIELGTQDEWLEFVYEGREFKMDVVDALDMLSAVDRRHRDDANVCSSCGCPHGFVTDVKPGPAKCQACDRGVLVLNSAILREVADELCKRFNLPRMSVSAARDFRAGVMARRDAAKKKHDPSPELPTGSESTAEIGVN